MQTVYREITKEEFEQYKEPRTHGREEFINNKAGMDIVWGYGLYGSRFIERDGKFLIEMRIGDTCD